MKYVYKFGAAALAILIIVIAVFTPLICIGIESFLASTIVTLADASGNEEAKALLDSRLISYKADKVLEYLNQNMK